MTTVDPFGTVAVTNFVSSDFLTFKALLERPNGQRVDSATEAETIGDWGSGTDFEFTDVLLCDATTAPFTVTLPDATKNGGRKLTIKKVDASANAVTIDGAGSQTIDGATTDSLASQYDSLTMVSDGVEWWLI